MNPAENVLSNQSWMSAGGFRRPLQQLMIRPGGSRWFRNYDRKPRPAVAAGGATLDGEIQPNTDNGHCPPPGMEGIGRTISKFSSSASRRDCIAGTSAPCGTARGPQCNGPVWTVNAVGGPKNFVLTEGVYLLKSKRPFLPRLPPHCDAVPSARSGSANRAADAVRRS
jgi:hypothetical protein